MNAVTTGTENGCSRESALVFHEDGLLNQELEFLCQAADSYGHSYDLYLGQTSRTPVVRSRATGRYFLLQWSQIVRQAVEAGIDVSA